MISLIALISFVVGLVVFASASREVPKELGRLAMWAGFFVLVAELAQWHAIVVR